MTPWTRFCGNCALVLVAVHAAHAQPNAPGPTVGNPAPPITLNELLQSPEGASATWEDLRGKVVVLEFWATWCVPCVAAFPHLNELADKFSDQPVQFIAITYQDRKTTAPFLKRKPLHTWVGLDTNRSMHTAYGVHSVPQTFVVAPDGRLAHHTYPTKLTAEMIEDLLAGKRPVLPEVAAAAKAKPPLFQVLIRPTAGAIRGEITNESGKLTATGVTLQAAIAYAYGFPERRIVATQKLPEGAYDIQIVLPTGRDGEVQARLRDALEATFGIQTRRETREADGFVLSLLDGEELLVSPETRPRVVDVSTDKSGKGHLRATHVPVETFASTLADILRREVFCQTPAAGEYDFDVRWDSYQPESLLEVLPQDTGMKLEPAKRPVEVLIVEIVSSKRA